MSMKAALDKLLKRQNLTSEESAEVMNIIATGGADPVQTSAFLVLLASKGETADEIAGLVRTMRSHACQVSIASSKVLDIVGTGGDGFDTVNISTAAAVLAAACGATVAKHGNRSVSSKSGSADVLEEMGVVMLDPPHIGPCVKSCGIAFMFAPKFHPAMKYVVPVRKSLGVRTVFNILGPLLNPAGAKHLMLGVYSADLLQVYGQTLHSLGVDHALVVHCQGMDELTAIGSAQAVEITPKGVESITIDPASMGIPKCTVQDLKGGDGKENAGIVRHVLSGKAPVNEALANTIALNTGAGLYVYGSASSIEEGFKMAREAIRQGKAVEVLDAWAKESQSLSGDGNKDPKIQKTA
eukprot:gnl/MRDRNA2_/MRDRNA2_102699_c0_seq1.p1 gnl/MRDRNA2_/MRDRNA2_102699_c0~~gnl/MRDRNA2_/MRDRNA2_102699_c0_seq1.p1  ORF type:complete len:354 (-),score=74.26 gnl/MRDRNA2_/MRDRNA2_102699_c0_seq1:126-1187(-)